MSSGCLVALKATGTSALKVARILVALKATLSTPIADGRHSVFQVFGSSESYRNVTFQSCRDFGSSESYIRQERPLSLLKGLW